MAFLRERLDDLRARLGRRVRLDVRMDAAFCYRLRSLRTLRFLVIARAGRLTRIAGRQVLRLAQNPATEELYAQIAHRLAA